MSHALQKASAVKCLGVAVSPLAPVRAWGLADMTEARFASLALQDGRVQKPCPSLLSCSPSFISLRLRQVVASMDKSAT